MSHTRFALGFSRHKKVAGLSDGAFRLWVSAMDRARETACDGLLDDGDLDLVPKCPPKSPKRTAYVNELVDAGLWEVRDKSWQIHDYLDWQDSSEQIKARRANASKRMREVRANKKRTGGEVRSGSSYSSSSGSESASEGVQGEPSPARAETFPELGLDERETMCPLDLLERRGVRIALAELAEKLPAPPSVLEAEAREFVGYWTIGEGAGKLRSNWPSRLRERIRKRFQAGELGSGVMARPNSDWPTDDALRLREAIRAGKHGDSLQAKERAGNLDFDLARRLIREAEDERTDVRDKRTGAVVADLSLLTAGIGRRV